MANRDSELRNSPTTINLLPLDVLLLIPTHLASLSDRLRVTLVCRRWRRVFLQYAQLWSQLHLAGNTNQDLLTTLLERAKRFPLDITLDYSEPPIHGVALLSPFAQQIGHLTVNDACGDDIQNLSMAISGFLPSLHTLTIEDNGDDASLRPPSAPIYPLFEGAANVKEFVLDTFNSLILPHFAFPNLTTFKFLTWERLEAFPASLLLNFLEASPSLQEISMEITRDICICHKDVPLDRVIVLPCVESFYLNIMNDSSGWELATHLSCPSAERAGFVCRLRSAEDGDKIPEGIYPPSLLWSAIARQYTMGTVNKVVLELKEDEDPTCSIIFWSSDEVSLDLFYDHSVAGSDDRDMPLDARIGTEVLSRAFRTIRDHPLLTNVRILCIKGGGLIGGDLELAAKDIKKLLGSMGPLEELVLIDCDLQPYIGAFLETSPLPDAIQPTSFPTVKEFTIINPIQSLCDDEAYASAVVELAKSQHARGVPFEVVTLRPPASDWAVVELLLSVNTVECYGKLMLCADCCSCANSVP